MEKPIPPRLEDFGLSQAEYEKIPRLLYHYFSEKTYTRLGFVMGCGIGLMAFMGFFNKINSTLHGWFFGIPIGFVAFITGTFLSAIFIKYLIRFFSFMQRCLYGAYSDTARRAFLFDDAMRKYTKAMGVFKNQYR